MLNNKLAFKIVTSLILEMMLKVLIANIKLLLSIAVVFSSILYRNELKSYYEAIIGKLDSENKPGVYSKTELAGYDGVARNNLYLAVLGRVFDVTEGKRHYEKGAAYHYFVGKDGSRGLVTGHFKDESDQKDHVMDLSCNDLFTLVHWQNTFQQKYIEVGVLAGRYYDNNGEETAYTNELNNKLKACEVEKDNSKREEQKYPPCNIAWSSDTGTKVWCTKSSGGVKRSWSGVPRELYTPGVEKPRCVCINSVGQDAVGLIKEYKDCPKSSTECVVKS